MSWALAPATTTLSGPPLASARMLRLLPALPRSVGWRRVPPPQTGLAHGAVSRLPFPVHRSQFLALLNQHRPDALQNAEFNPALEGLMDGAVVSQFPGQAVPVATGAHPEYDAVQDSPRLNALAPRGLGRVHLQNGWLNPFPQIIRDFPYRWQSLARSLRWPQETGQVAK